MSLPAEIPPQPDPMLILASGSPRRRALLAMAGFDFDVRIPAVDEAPLPAEAPDAMVMRLAVAKAGAVADTSPPEACILAADTTVVLDGEALGKPASEEEAAAMLLRLADRSHVVITAYALRPPWEPEPLSGTVTSHVTMRPITAGDAAAYAAGGEPLDKAGAYALQGEGGRFVAEVTGSRSNVIGLPIETIVPLLWRYGLASRRN